MAALSMPKLKMPVWIVAVIMAAYVLGPRMFTFLRQAKSKVPKHLEARYGGLTASAATMNVVGSSRDALRSISACVHRDTCRARYPKSLQLSAEQRRFLGAQRWFIAITLRNNAALMDHYIHELLVAISVLRGNEFPSSDDCQHKLHGSGNGEREPTVAGGGGGGGARRGGGGGGTGSAFVSMFESNSKDSTSAYLSLIDDLLTASGVGHSILTTLELDKLRANGELEGLLRGGTGAGGAGAGAGAAKGARRLLAVHEEGEYEVLGSEDGYEGVEEVLGVEGRVLARWRGGGGGKGTGNGTGVGGRTGAAAGSRRLEGGKSPATTAAEDAAAIDSILFHPTGGGHSDKDSPQLSWQGNRIAFLARVRNWVMRPLYEHAAAWEGAGGGQGKTAWPATAGASTSGSGSTSGSSGGGSPSPTPPRAGAGGVHPYTRVVFLNDVYYCAEDIIRLALNTVGVEGSGVPGAVTGTAGALLGHTPPATGAGAGAGAASMGTGSSSSTASGGLPGVFVGHHAGGGADVSCGMDFDSTTVHATGFYDMWVARDVQGQEFRKQPPFMRREVEVRALKAGKPVPVFCCWNGAVVATAAPYYPPGVPAAVSKGSPGGPVRFRTGGDGECKGSECSQWCKDMWSAGAGHFLMDPHVRLAYSPDTWSLLAPGGSKARADWLTAEARQEEMEGTPAEWPPSVDFPMHPPGRVHCCGLAGVGREPDQGCINEQLILPQQVTPLGQG